MINNPLERSQVGKILLVAVLAFQAAPSTQALVNGLAPQRAVRPVVSSSPFRQQDAVRQVAALNTNRCNTALLQQTEMNHEDGWTPSQRRRASSIKQLLLSLRHGCTLKSTLVSPPNSSTRRASRFQIIKSLNVKRYFLTNKSRDLLDTSLTYAAGASSSLFGNTSRKQIRIWWKSCWKKITALTFALFIVFSPLTGPEGAHAGQVDYFAPLAHSRVVPSPLQRQATTQDPAPSTSATTQVEEWQVAPTEVTAGVEDHASLAGYESEAAPRKTASFASSDAASLAMKRAAQERVAAKTDEPAAAAAAVVQTSLETQKQSQQVLAASLVAAAALGATLGTKMSAGSVGGYSSYSPEERDDDSDDLTDKKVGGFSQYKPPTLPLDDDSPSDNGFFRGFGSGIGGFSGYEPEDPPGDIETTDRSSTEPTNMVGTFSQQKPELQL